MSVVNLILYLLAGGISCLVLLLAGFWVLERYGESLFTSLGILRDVELKKKSI